MTNIKFIGVELPEKKGGIVLTDLLKTPNTIIFLSCNQTTSDKVSSREGKSPDHKLRSLNTK